MHTTDLLRTPFTLAGAALGATVQVVAAVRNVPKPLHPRGRYTHATVTRFGNAEPSGVAWLDNKATSSAVVRHSGAIGFPLGWPDIQGLAVRIEEEQGPGDLLFATTGMGRLSRYLLTGSTRIDGRPYTTLLPYGGPTGPILLGLEPRSATTMTLLWARGSGRWRAFGAVQLTDPYDGPAISFDPMLTTLPDLVPYPWVRALRAPAYRAARRHRGEVRGEPGSGGDLLTSTPGAEAYGQAVR